MTEMEEGQGTATISARPHRMDGGLVHQRKGLQQAALPILPSSWTVMMIN